MRGLLLAAALVAPAAASAQVASEAQEFGRLYLPAAATTAHAEESFRKEASRALDQQPQVAAMEKRYPTLRKALLDAGAQVTRQQYVARVPGMQARVATLASTSMTSDELRDVNAFLRSGTGQAVQAAMRSNTDTGKLAGTAQASGGTPVLTPEQAASTIDVAGAVGALTPDQLSDVARFSATAAGRKFQQISPQLLAIMTDETNRLLQETVPKVQQAMLMAMRAQAAPAGKGN